MTFWKDKFIKNDTYLNIIKKKFWSSVNLINVCFWKTKTQRHRYYPHHLFFGYTTQSSKINPISIFSRLSTTSSVPRKKHAEQVGEKIPDPICINWLLRTAVTGSLLPVGMGSKIFALPRECVNCLLSANVVL